MAMWHCGQFELDTSEPLLMGILNVTPDSFSDGGQHNEVPAALEHARALVAEGAHVIDVGGESTRPGSDEVAPDAELARVLPVVRALAAEGTVVSVDTRHAEVAAACLDAGAAIINDVTGFRQQAMRELASTSDAGMVLMHMQGEPKSMQASPQYGDVVAEVGEWLHAQAALLVADGVAPARICLDPGPGFGKSFEHNLALLRATAPMAAAAAAAGYGWMAAWSRKGFIGAVTGEAEPARRAAGSVAAACYAAARGATVMRVHDVAATAQALAVIRLVRSEDF